MERFQSGTSRIEFWFDFASNYSYLSTARIGDLARAQSVVIDWKPFLLGPIFRSLGMETSPFVLQKEKGAYVWKGMARRCSKYGLAPWSQPSAFPRSSVLAARIAVLALGADWMERFCRRVFELNFVDDRDISDLDEMTRLLGSLGLPAGLIEDAQSEPVKQKLRSQTDEAQRCGIFGAPMFFVGGEMFWGDDRLEDALCHAANGGAGRVE